MNQVHIRLLSEADATAYTALRLRGLREHPEAFTSSYEEESQRPLSWAVQRLQADLAKPNDFFLGALEGDELVGLVGLQGHYRIKERHNATVVGMLVLAQHRGSGIGHMLLSGLLERARTLPGLTQLDLTVTEGNPAAQQLYERCGFQVYGVHRQAILVAGMYHAKVMMSLQLHPAS